MGLIGPEHIGDIGSGLFVLGLFMIIVGWVGFFLVFGDPLLLGLGSFGGQVCCALIGLVGFVIIFALTADRGWN